MGISNIISLFGGIALFLFGMNIMGDGLKQAAGNKMELVLYKLTGTPIKGVLMGVAVTSVIQSSSATSVMVVGFANSGMMQLVQAISVIMGSFIGTSITGWVICLSEIGVGAQGLISLVSTATITGIAALIGIIMKMFAKSDGKKHFGGILLGFAVLMYGISAMSGAVAPLKESEAFVSLMTRFSNPVLGLLVGIAVTAVLQSASSAVGLLQALAITGAINFSAAFPIILGMGIGALVPVLLSSMGTNCNARRSAWSYLIISVIGAVVCGVIYYALDAIVHFGFTGKAMTAVSIAIVNTIFRAIAVALQFPFCRILSNILTKLIPEDVKEKELIPNLEDKFLKNPDLALAHCSDAVNEMAGMVQQNILDAMALIDDYSEEKFAKLENSEEIVDQYEEKLGSYIIKLNTTELSREHSRSASIFLHAIGDLERISDHSVNIGECAAEIYKKEITFSPSGKYELDTARSAICEVLDMSVRSFKDKDTELAKQVEPLEEVIDDLSDEMKLHHIGRLTEGICTLENGFVFNDLVTNFERISDHCSNIAVNIIEMSKENFDAHAYTTNLKNIHDEVFDRYYDNFSKKYNISNGNAAAAKNDA